MIPDTIARYRAAYALLNSPVTKSDAEIAPIYAAIRVALREMTFLPVRSRSEAGEVTGIILTEPAHGPLQLSNPMLQNVATNLQAMTATTLVT